MRSAIQKLKSQTGASITFALLLFLVCAVISSVVIVAATTAAGRMSQLPEMDRRYYAVISATRLLQSEIDGKKVSVEYSKADKEATAKTIEKDAVIINIEEDPPVILIDASERLVEMIKNDVDDATTREWDVTVNESEIIDYLSCTIHEVINPNGLLAFAINSGGYQLEMTFSSNIRQFASDSNAPTALTTVEWRFLGLHKIRNTAVAGGGGA